MNAITRAALALAASVMVLGLAAGCSGDNGAADVSAAPDVAASVDVVQSECDYDAQCEALISAGICQVARCVQGRCEATAAPQGADCPLAGTPGDCERGSCSGSGACVPATAHDGTACRTDAWDGCSGYRCEAGACALTALVTCDDQQPCTDDSCDPATGACLHAANTAPCDDEDACTAGDVCTGGACVGAQPLCQCEQDADCAAFEDGDACNGTLRCDIEARLCVPAPGGPVVCDTSGDAPCEETVCDPASGQCALQDKEAYALCDDGDPCTGCAPGEACAQHDFCQAGICAAGLDTPCACAADADCAAFDDDDACNGAWRCLDGTCADVPGACCAVDADCAALEDELTCTPAWRCEAGVCLEDAASAPDCAAADACQIGSCTEPDGACAYQDAADGVACDDGDPCSGADQCVGGACQAGATELCGCAVDADCAASPGGPECVAGKCRACDPSGHAGCDPAGFRPLCDGASYDCLPCADDAPCVGNPANGATCWAGACSDAPCAVYCELVGAACQGDDAPYADGAECLATCDDWARWPHGTPGDEAGNSVACRISHAVHAAVNQPAAASHCPHASPAGGDACGGWCENYCWLTQLNCTGADALYADDATCLAACVGLAADGDAGDAVGDSVQCRITQAVLAGSDLAGGSAATYCPQAALVGTTACVYQPTTFDAIHPIFKAHCDPCHTTSTSGGHSIGAPNTAVAFVESQKSSFTAGTTTKGEAALVLIKKGTMPLGAGCTGDPAQDSDNPACLDAAEQALIGKWLADGQLPPPE